MLQIQHVKLVTQTEPPVTVEYQANQVGEDYDKPNVFITVEGRSLLINEWQLDAVATNWLRLRQAAGIETSHDLPF